MLCSYRYVQYTIEFYKRSMPFLYVCYRQLLGGWLLAAASEINLPVSANYRCCSTPNLEIYCTPAFLPKRGTKPADNRGGLNKPRLRKKSPRSYFPSTKSYFFPPPTHPPSPAISSCLLRHFYMQMRYVTYRPAVSEGRMIFTT